MEGEARRDSSSVALLPLPAPHRTAPDMALQHRLVTLMTLCLGVGLPLGKLVVRAEDMNTDGLYFNHVDAQMGTYHFGYDTGLSRHQSFREETRTPGGGVRGRFGYVESGVLRVTEYIADHLGYRCRETVRFLVNTDRSVRRAHPQQVDGADARQTRFFRPTNDRGKAWLQYNVDPQSRKWSGKRPAAAEPGQPARVMGKKVAGQYKDFTNEPAVGGTAAVFRWDSAHGAAAELREEELLGLGHIK